MKQIQKEHVALVIKYTGISFITGGLSHGFFSGERQIISAGVGIVFFIIGTLLEQKTGEKEYMRTIIFSSILAIAIGALTGGLQHFPDSPDRSLWIVPLGFLISVYAYISLEKGKFMKKTHLIYTGVGFLLFIGISLGFYALVQGGYIGGEGHGHGNEHSEVQIQTQDINLGTGIANDTIGIDENINFEGDGHNHDH